MKLARLDIQNLRLFSSTQFSFGDRVNIIPGPNGSGKTTLLEALYLLSTGNSFRTRESNTLIRFGQDRLTLFAKTWDDQSLSLQKSLKAPTIARINQTPCFTASELTAFLPCQIFYQDLFQIIDSGPAVRRQLLDWGLFHVEPNYFSVWKTYRQALKQRNALLRQGGRSEEIHPWNSILVEQAVLLHEYRSRYVLNLVEIFVKTLARLSKTECDIEYYKGWDKKNEGKTLLAILQDSYQMDYQRQYTQFGAHNADLIIKAASAKGKNYFSRGEQKIILFALKLAQAKMLPMECIFLIDDLSAELDRKHTHYLLNYINESPGQFFITVREGDELISSAELNYTVVNVPQSV